MDKKNLDLMLEEGAELIELSPSEYAKWEDILKVMPVEYGKKLDAQGKPGTKVIKFLKEYLESH